MIALSDKRIRAHGRIVAAATATNLAFGAFHEVQTDETGATKRFGYDRHASRAKTSACLSPAAKKNMRSVTGPPGANVEHTMTRSTSTWCLVRPSMPYRSAASVYTNGWKKSFCRWFMHECLSCPSQPTP